MISYSSLIPLELHDYHFIIVDRRELIQDTRSLFSACKFDKGILTFFAHLFMPASPANERAIEILVIGECFIYFTCVFCAKPEL